MNYPIKIQLNSDNMHISFKLENRSFKGIIRVEHFWKNLPKFNSSSTAAKLNYSSNTTKHYIYRRKGDGRLNNRFRIYGLMYGCVAISNGVTDPDSMLLYYA